MNATEIIALIFAILVLVKAVLVPLVNPKWMINLVKKLFSSSVILSGLFTVLAVVLGYFLLQEMTIVQLMAAALFGMSLFGLIIAAYPKGYLKLAEVVMKNVKRSWYVFVIFVVLALWVLYTLFM